jgi:ribonuclease P protein component
MTDKAPPRVSPSILGLTVRRQFLYVAQGRKAAGRFSLLQIRASAEQTTMIRFGLTASKKVGNAVARNRARRRLRVAMKALLPVYGLVGHDYVAVARTATTQAKWADLLDDLKRLFIRLALVSADCSTDAPSQLSTQGPASGAATGPSPALDASTASVTADPTG